MLGIGKKKSKEPQKAEKKKPEKKAAEKKARTDSRKKPSDQKVLDKTMAEIHAAKGWVVSNIKYTTSNGNKCQRIIFSRVIERR